MADENETTDEQKQKQLIGRMADELGPWFAQTVKDIEPCAKGLAAAQKALIAAIGDVYVTNEDYIGTTLEDSAAAISKSTGGKSTSYGKYSTADVTAMQRVSKAWPQGTMEEIVKAPEPTGNTRSDIARQQRGSAYGNPEAKPTKVADPPSTYHKILDSDASLLPCVDVPPGGTMYGGGIEDPTPIEQATSGAKLVDPHDADFQLDAGLESPIFPGLGLEASHINIYPTSWASLFATILAQAKLLTSEPNLLTEDIAASLLDPGEGTTQAIYQTVTQANHADTGDNISIDSDGRSNSVYNIVNFGGEGLFGEASKEEIARQLTPQQLLTQLANVAGKKFTSEPLGSASSFVGEILEKAYQAMYSHLVEIKKHSDCIKKLDDQFREKQKEIADRLKEEQPEWPWEKDTPLIDEALKQLEAGDIEEFLGGSTFMGNHILFKEQCWLLGYVDLISSYKKEILDKRYKDLAYVSGPTVANPFQASSNASVLVDGDPYAFLNRLTLNPNLSNYFDIDNHELSNLQPKIQLYKVVNEDNDGKEIFAEVPFNFDSYFNSRGENGNLGGVLKDKKARGYGVGVKSFNFVYDGSNPFAIKKSISANLKIFAASFQELFEIRQHIHPVHGVIKYQYSDLALKTGTVKKNECFDQTRENIDLAALNFRLRAKVGIASPNTLAGRHNKGLKEALQESHVTLNLTPTTHNFEIDELGRVIFNINYLAYIEEMFDQTAYNIFAGAKRDGILVSYHRIKRELEINEVKKQCGMDDVNKKKETYEEEIAVETANSLSFLIESLRQNQKIYYIPLTNEALTKFTVKGPFADEGKMRQEMMEYLWRPGESDPDTGAPTNSAFYITQDPEMVNSDLQTRTNNAMKKISETVDSDEKKKNVITALTAGSDPKNHVISYFYVSDLVDVILRNIEGELGALPLDVNLLGGEGIQRAKELNRHAKNFKQLRILLGPAEFFTTPDVSSKSSDEKYSRNRVETNLGDVPISIKYFLEWMTDKMLKKEEIYYPLTKFLNDLFNSLVREFLNNDTCFGFSIKQKTRVQQACLTSYKSPKHKYDPLTQKIVDDSVRFEQNRLNLKKVPIGTALLDLSGVQGTPVTTVSVEDEINYFTFFAGRVMPKELMKGDKKSDTKRGIFHYLLGRDKGIIKNIKMSKTQTTGLAEVRFESDGYDGLAQLRVIYDVQVDTFANVNTFPGTYIYVDPAGFSPGSQSVQSVSGESKLTLSDLGIGGYYMIYKSEHAFGPGYSNSILHAKWVNSIENEATLEECKVLSETTYGDGSRRNAKCDILVGGKGN